MKFETKIKAVAGTSIAEESYPKLDGFSRGELEEEIHKLRMSLTELKANSGVRTEFGYLKTDAFLERAREEFARSRRYGSPLTLVVLTMMGYEKIKANLGQKACDHYVSKLAQKCKDSCREGADILGLIDDDRFGFLLPEADITGCTRFKERLKEELAGSQITWKNAPIKSGMKISAGVLLKEDESFDELFERTTLQKAVLDKKVA